MSILPEKKKETFQALCARLGIPLWKGMAIGNHVKEAVKKEFCDKGKENIEYKKERLKDAIGYWENFWFNNTEDQRKEV